MSLLSLLAALVVTVAFFRRPRPRAVTLRAHVTRAAIVLAQLAALAIACAGLAALWYFHRPQPKPTREALFRGVTYERDVRTAPRPIVAHVVAIDLRAPGVHFVVSPRQPYAGFDLRGNTTSRFLKQQGAQLAINGDFFLPWWSEGLDDFYPQIGQGVACLGAAVSGGVEYGYRVVPFSTLVFAPGGAVSIVETTEHDAPLPPAELAISGKQVIVADGAPTPAATHSSQANVRHPRSAAALDRSGNTLFLVAIDGRQPGYSEGVTLGELASILLEHGAYRAMNLDGGGSTSIAADDGEGGSRLINIPIHTRVPWRERVVANHLGVFAEPLDGP